VSLAPRRERLLFERDGRDWPHRERSAFVRAGGVEWHVQIFGAGPVALLVHGTGASTHSWRDVAPLLAARFTVVAIDLPGHGFSTPLPPHRMTLPSVAAALGVLVATQGAPLAVVVGHSAGAAILARALVDGAIAAHALVAFNGALLPLRGVSGHVFSPAAKLLAAAPFVPRWVTRRARDSEVIRRLVGDMGSTLSPAALEWYARLGASAEHVGAALAMMAHWDLAPLARDLPRLRVPTTLAIGERDRAIAPSDGERVARLLPHATIRRLAGLGHLAHEEAPMLAAELVTTAARAALEHAPAGRVAHG
jgi:magnesium chelatase accessory protein